MPGKRVDSREKRTGSVGFSECFGLGMSMGQAPVVGSVFVFGETACGDHDFPSMKMWIARRIRNGVEAAVEALVGGWCLEDALGWSFLEPDVARRLYPVRSFIGFSHFGIRETSRPGVRCFDCLWTCLSCIASQTFVRRIDRV